jgi:hypothetical protein
MDTTFIIGNGESRNIFPIQHLKNKGIIYGCNAIYRDYPELCDHIVAVNLPMYEELTDWHTKTNSKIKIHGPEDISQWNYVLPDDIKTKVPHGLKLYRIWRGGNYKKHNITTLDFSEARGTGCSAILLAAESGIKNIVILAFDIMGSKQWEFQARGEISRDQNNIYKNTNNYPSRLSMKAYLKYEWMYQMRQIIKKFPDTNFYFINRLEYIRMNPFLRWYFNLENIKVGIYADLKRWIENERNNINWLLL